MKNVDEKMEKITGEKKIKNRTVEQDNEMLAQKRQNAEPETKEEHSFAWDLFCEFRRVNRRQFIEKVILILVLLITNLVWLLTFTAYDFVSYGEVSVEGGENAAYYQPIENGKGEVTIHNGENSSAENKDETPTE